MSPYTTPTEPSVNAQKLELSGDPASAGVWAPDAAAVPLAVLFMGLGAVPPNAETAHYITATGEAIRPTALGSVRLDGCERALQRTSALRLHILGNRRLFTHQRDGYA